MKDVRSIILGQTNNHHSPNQATSQSAEIVSMKNRHWLVLALASFGLVGCEEPDQVVNVTPPGLYVDRTPEEEKGFNGPQALGEAAAQTNATPVSRSSSGQTELESGINRTLDESLKPKQEK
jgi:hypothetical protein